MGTPTTSGRLFLITALCLSAIAACTSEPTALPEVGVGLDGGTDFTQPDTSVVDQNTAFDTRPPLDAHIPPDAQKQDASSCVEGKVCDDKDPCTHGDTCQQGKCKGTAYQCDDGLSCTTDTCTGTGPAPGGCTFTPKPKTCLIAGKCYNEDDAESTNPCNKCFSATSATSWTEWKGVNCVHRVYYTAATDIAIDSAGTLRYSMYSSVWNRPAGQSFAMIAGSGAFGYVNGTLTAARFTGLSGLVYDEATKKTYLSDTVNYRIRLIDGATVSTIAGDGQNRTADGNALSASFFEPRGLSLDTTSKDLYVADGNGHRVRLLSGGKVTSVAGTGVAGYVNGALNAAQFSRPVDVLYLAPDKVFVADWANHAIRLIDLTTKKVSTFAGTGVAGYKDGALGVAQFNYPHGLAIDSTGKRLIVADKLNYSIREISLTTNMVSTIAGSGKPGAVDGEGRKVARFRGPVAVTIHTTGEIYVADSGITYIRRIIP